MKKYELTQEQINQLAEKKHAKELLQKFIPDAFEAKLEVGKWYKAYYKEGYCLFNFQEYSDENKTKNYGFTNTKMHNYGWAEEGIVVYERDENIPATEEEVREAIINEAIKRGFKNVGELSLKIVSGEMFKKGSFGTANNNFRYISVENSLYLDGVEIFYNGKWAEIVIEDIPTQEEIDRVINYLKK